MIRSGDTIKNPVTGESITFHQTSADTNGEAVVIECSVQPHGFVAAAHVHPSQTERFAVVEGWARASRVRAAGIGDDGPAGTGARPVMRWRWWPSATWPGCRPAGGRSLRPWYEDAACRSP